MALSVVLEECAESGGCVDKAKALPFKIIAIISILVTSLIGVCSLLFTCLVLALQLDCDHFIVVKCFAVGVILATGFRHVLLDAFDMLSSQCLKENPRHKFLFTAFVAVLSTLEVDPIATSVYKNNFGIIPNGEGHDVDREMSMATVTRLRSHSHRHHHHRRAAKVGAMSSQLLCYRVVAMIGSYFGYCLYTFFT